MAISTAEDRGPLLNVGMWIALVPTCMMVAAKVYTKWITTSKIVTDDFLMFIALLMAIAQSVATTEEVYSGLGRPQAGLSNEQVDSFLISQYVANVFYILCIYITKLSTVCFYPCLCGNSASRQVVRWTIWFISLWTVAAVFVLFFQCSLPQPWNILESHCINLRVFWTVNLVIDILTQITVACLPIYLLRSLHIAKRSKKWLAMAAFTPNSIIIPLSVLRLTYLYQALASPDATWNSFNFGLLSSLQAFMGVMVASLPFAKPVLDSLILQPYLIGNDETNTLTPGYAKASTWARSLRDSRVASPLHGGSSSRKEKTRQWPLTSHWEDEREEIDLGNHTSISAKRAMKTGVSATETEALESRHGSTDEMVIHQTKTATVTTQ